MSRGRKRLIEPTIPWKIHIPVNLATEIELILADPLTGNITYGARGTLITQLLREWKENKQKEKS